MLALITYNYNYSIVEVIVRFVHAIKLSTTIEKRGDAILDGR